MPRIRISRPFDVLTRNPQKVTFSRSLSLSRYTQPRYIHPDFLQRQTYQPCTISSRHHRSGFTRGACYNHSLFPSHPRRNFLVRSISHRSTARSNKTDVEKAAVYIRRLLPRKKRRFRAVSHSGSVPRARCIAENKGYVYISPVR